MTDDDLSKLYRRGMTNGRARDAADAPTLEAMLRVIRGEADEEERLRTLDRVMASASLRDEFALLSAVDEGERRAAPARPRWIAAAAAAVLLLVASGVLWQSRRAAPEGDVVRGGADAIVLVAPRERLEANRSFTWRPAGGESRYRFQLRDAQGGVLFDIETRDTTLVLPANVAVLPDQEYRWWVRAERADGSQARSAIASIRGGGPD